MKRPNGLALPSILLALIASALAAQAQPKIAVLARVPAAREMAVCGNTLYVGTLGSAVYAVPIGGGRAKVVAQDFVTPNGVACSGRRLFVASRDRITAFDIGPGGALSARKVIRSDLPNLAHHGLRYIQVGPDGRLYVALGSPCNICLPKGLQGTIVSMNKDGSDLKRVATGVRNSVGFDWRGKTLFFTDNGADNMGDNIPPDELNEVVRPGAFYGFPYFGGRIRLKGFESATPPQTQTPPVFEFQAHVATLGLLFYRGGAFPDLRGDALAAEHGSWNRTVPVGRQVVVVRFQGGRPAGVQTFVRGVGRPVDVKQAPDGAILVSNDAGGTIYKITNAQR